MPEDIGDKGMAKKVDTIGRHTTTKERQPQAMSEYEYVVFFCVFTISLINHPSKVILQVVLSRLKATAGEPLAEEQADCRQMVKEHIVK